MGFYEASFALRDGNIIIGLSDNIVMVKIIDVDEAVPNDSHFLSDRMIIRLSTIISIEENY